jgi:hypothetical protein
LCLIVRNISDIVCDLNNDHIDRDINEDPHCWRYYLCPIVKYINEDPIVEDISCVSLLEILIMSNC